MSGTELRAGAWNEGPHLLSHLTIRQGPNSGASTLYCTCGWQTYTPTLDETKRLGDQHNGLCGSRWGREIK